MISLYLVTYATLLAQAVTTPAPKKPIYINPELVDASVLLAAPPAKNSAQSLLGMAELHRVQETRTKERIEQALWDDGHEDIFAFHTVLGAKFQREAMPKTSLLDNHLRNDAGIVASAGKKAFQRPRPHMFDPSIKPVCKSSDRPNDYAYPGGHSTVGHTSAIILAMMVPDKRDAIYARADDYSFSRVVCGVHYPEDGPASRILAQAIVAHLMTNAQFKAEFDAAKMEVRAAMGMGGTN